VIPEFAYQDALMQTYSQTYLPLLWTYQDELLQRLELLVNIDSGTGQKEGIDTIIAHLQQWLSDIDFVVTLHDAGQYGHNLVATRRGNGRARLLIVGHVDTVYKPGATLVQPFYIQDGLAYGPGVIDMKSGVLMGMYALRALIESGFDHYGELTIFFNNDEEIGSLGSAPLLRHISRQIDAALVLEPSRSAEIVTNARKGADRYTLEVQGVPAHSGAEPHQGRSAVIELAHKMIAIHNLNTMFRGVTFNVTRISSSEQLNVVPDVAHCHISVRAFDEDGLDQAAAALEAIRAGCSIPGTRTTLARTRGRMPYKATTGITRLVEMAQAEGKGLGLHLVAESKGGVSDANLLAESGIPALDSLGPVGGGMHDLHREYLRIESLPLRGALLAGLIQRLCLSESTGE